MMSQAREEKRGKRGGAGGGLQSSEAAVTFIAIVSHALALLLFHLKTNTKSCVLTYICLHFELFILLWRRRCFEMLLEAVL